MVSSMWRELDISDTPVDTVQCNKCHQICHRNKILLHLMDHSISPRFLTSKIVPPEPPQIDKNSDLNNQKHCFLEISCANNNANSSSAAVVCERRLSRTNPSSKLGNPPTETLCSEFSSPEKTAAKLSESCKLDKSSEDQTAIYHCDSCVKTPAITCTVCKLNNLRTKSPIPIEKLNYKQSKAAVDSKHSEVEKPFKCSLCICAYPSKRSLMRHLKKHNFERSKITAEDSRTRVANRGIKTVFECETCKYFYSSCRNLRRHIKRMHPKEIINSSSQPFTSFKHRKNERKCLVSQESSPRQIPCGIGNAAFKFNNQAIIHRKIKHSKALLNSITKLPKSRSLTRHCVLKEKRIDPTTQCIPKMYYCSPCHIRFSSESSLKRHEKLHVQV